MSNFTETCSMSIAHEGNQRKSFNSLAAESAVKPAASATADSITYASGYRRTDDVPAFDLLEPAFLLEMAQVMSEGEKKHGRENWKLATPAEQHITVRHLQGHLNKWLMGDRSEPHLAKVAIGAMFLHFHQCK